MTNRKVNNWPQVYARIGGVLYLFNILAGLFGEVFVRNNLIVAGDAAATAHKIMTPTSCFAALLQATCSCTSLTSL
ncbi:MAG TPA: DUF4386 family protein [Verrucomicrobiae bacterium]|nr:DUF4386 family protein [Verrucomicrobiae bacterium]